MCLALLNMLPDFVLYSNRSVVTSSTRSFSRFANLKISSSAVTIWNSDNVRPRNRGSSKFAAKCKFERQNFFRLSKADRILAVSHSDKNDWFWRAVLIYVSSAAPIACEIGRRREATSSVGSQKFELSRILSCRCWGASQLASMIDNRSAFSDQDFFSTFDSSLPIEWEFQVWH